MSQQPPFAPAQPGEPAQPGHADFDIAARYAPPEAHVAAVSPERPQGDPMWFSVSPFKLLVMCTVTFQFYSVYWFYKQWRLVRTREKSSIVPALRALFSVLFIWALFTRVRDAQGGVGVTVHATALAAGWVVTSLLWKGVDAAWWLTFFSPLFLLPVQGAMNAMNDAATPGHPRNDGFGILNWIGIVLGGGFLALALIGAFIPG
ncbi:hypothetical protein SAMN05216359_102195 [Roseateles sp. YR242]|uniref:hypothetical protein n=1 Tax=Roseateles sp. YR242 TaxID=1855305 RepID=UPI0008D4050F|nr:hypothetical protein [Roseateles sp. YR242]SEK55801.1 hypothetical protein SAMN05216359_102195 [Roseateles sp. YR242]